VTWLATSLLLFLKDRSERMIGGTRDLLYIFLLFVAFKVDDPASFTWKIVFLIPCMWFSALALLAIMVGGGGGGGGSSPAQEQPGLVLVLVLIEGRRRMCAPVPRARKGGARRAQSAPGWSARRPCPRRRC
jgi:hypothetical protein